MINGLSKKLLGLLLVATAGSYADDFDQSWNVRGRISLAPLIKRFAIHADELPVSTYEKIKKNEEAQLLASLEELDREKGTAELLIAFAIFKDMYAKKCMHGSTKKEDCDAFKTKLDLMNTYLSQKLGKEIKVVTSK